MQGIRRQDFELHPSGLSGCEHLTTLAHRLGARRAELQRPFRPRAAIEAGPSELHFGGAVGCDCSLELYFCRARACVARRYCRKMRGCGASLASDRRCVSGLRFCVLRHQAGAHRNQQDKQGLDARALCFRCHFFRLISPGCGDSLSQGGGPLAIPLTLFRQHRIARDTRRCS